MDLITAKQFKKMSFPDQRVELAGGEIIHYTLRGMPEALVTMRIATALADFC